MGSRDKMSRAVLCLLSLLCLLPLLVTVQAGGQYWWMGDGDAFGDYQDNQISNNQYQDNGQVQGFNNNNVLPVTQGLGQSQRQTNSCPAVSNVSPVSQCGGRASDCWSVGQPDVDCIDNALCCFDGCANVCQGPGSRSPAPPPNPGPAIVAQSQPRPQPRPQPQQQFQPQPRPQSRPVKPKPVRKQKPNRRPPVKKDPWPQQPQQQQQPRQPANNFQQSGGAGRRPSAPAESKPFVRCPSAMKCVPRVNCNLEGVMVNEVLNYTPAVEMLRVPLIPCVNTMAGNTIDVCCRDPNYQDPWPDMNNNSNNNNNNNFNNQINQRKG